MLQKLFNSADKKKLLSNFLALFSMQGLNTILPLITMPYLFRVLGAEKFGLIAFAYSLIAFLNVITDYGFNLSGTRAVSLSKDNHQELIKVYSRIQLAKLVLLTLSFILLSVLIILVEQFSGNWKLYYATFLFVIGNAIFPVWFFQGIEEMKYISYLNLVSKLFFTSTIFIFVQSADDYLYKPVLSGLGTIFIGLYSFYFVKKKYNISLNLQPLKDVIAELRDGWNIFLTSFIPNLYNNFAMFFLGFHTTMENVGYYSLATRIIDVSSSITGIIRNVTFPHLNNNFNDFHKIAKIMFFLGGFSFIIIVISAYTLLPIIFGNNFFNSLNYILILSLTPIFFAVTHSFGSNKLLVLKKDKIFSNIIMTSSLIGFFGALVFIPFFGVLGASINVIVTRGIIALRTFLQSKGVNYD